MERRRLGRTDIEVSALCLGTMTWGSQNSVDEACAQIDQALDGGVNFLDTAEMYPTTPRAAETTGDTERAIGDWLRRGGARDRVVIATKIIGDGYSLIRDGGPITPKSLRTAVEGSLQRLNTDYIDLYQLHWPNRGSFHFRKMWAFDPSGQPPRAAVRADIEATLLALDALIGEGKIRHVGVSNESSWGVSQFVDIAEREGLPRIASIQNEYSLLCRQFDTDLAETCWHEDVGLLSFTSLAAGLLTGKYENGTPAGSRATINAGLGGRWTDAAVAASADYVDLARRHGLDPAQMAYAWCLTRPFMTSVIIGATTPEQLRAAIGSASLRLEPEVMAEIASLHRRHPAPF